MLSCQNNQNPDFTKHSCGILLHLSSLPSPWGIGDMGYDAEKFIDFLHSSGQTLWQILPLNPLGLGNSPYQSPSVMAGNTLLISPDRLQEEGFLTKNEIQEGLNNLEQQSIQEDKVNFPMVNSLKDHLFRKAWTNFQSIENKVDYTECYVTFIKDNLFWLDDYCLYMALKKKYNHLSWPQWEESIALREHQTLELLKREMADEIAYQRFLQFTFFTQWQRVKSYANEKGIKIIGDLPIYVAADSCDTWVNKKFFKLDSKGRPASVGGVPPDYYSKNGQNWGNPLYDWHEMKKDGYFWWKSRLKHALINYDYIRLDHFRGFVNYWEIPYGEDTAVNGNWSKGPGKDFFDAVREHLGHLPFIIEDLGYLDKDVLNLKDYLKCPGMKVFQFEVSPVLNIKLEIKPLENSNTVYYSGTHDNDTLIGWFCNILGADRLSYEEKIELADNSLNNIYKSSANWVIIPMQDILKLDSSARMNTPGTVVGNWIWRMKKNYMSEKMVIWLKNLAVQSGRYTIKNIK